MPVKNVLLKTKEIPSLRVGIKWEPLEKDFHNYVGSQKYDPYAIRMKIITSSGFASVYRQSAHFIQKLGVLPDVAKKLKGSARDLSDVKAMLERDLEETEKTPYNLDLLCFCYDQGKNLKDLVSPLSIVPKNASRAQLSVLHSGDDTDGVGVRFDEEINVSLGDVAKDIHRLFFVVSSEDHGFDQIKDGLCSIISTKDEKSLLEKNLSSKEDKQVCVVAELSRTGDDWSLREMSEYLNVDEDPDSPLDDSIDDILRNKYL